MLPLALLLMMNFILATDLDVDQLRQARGAFEACRSVSGVDYVATAQTLCIRESITPSTSQRVLQLLNEKRAEIRYVVASGPGGHLTPALDIADALYEADLPVVVGDVCASSCAQFLFFGARRKVLLNGGAPVIHGGPLTEAYIEGLDAPEDSKVFLRAENDRFREFYRRRGISMDLLTVPPPPIQERLNRGEMVMWAWPPERLHEFGVTGLVVEPPTPQ